MDIVSMIFFILLGAGVFVITYMREKLNMKLTTALMFLGIVVGVIALLGFLAMNVEEGSVGELLLILLVGAPTVFVILCGIFYKDDNNQQTPK